MRSSTPGAKIKGAALALGRALKLEGEESPERLFSLSGEEVLMVGKGLLSRFVFEKAKLFGLTLPPADLAFEVPAFAENEELSPEVLFSAVKNPLNRVLIGEGLLTLKDFLALGLKPPEPVRLGIPERLSLLREQALACARKLGVRVFLVGGAVRDLLLGLEVFDLDLLVTDKASSFAEELSARLGAERVKSSLFGTFKLSWEGLELDVAQARWEYYEAPARLPRVFPGPLRLDLFRRDFTVNALALDLEDARLIDLYGGLHDLERRRLEVFHPLSFVDDPTRVFRAARYATRLALKPTPNFERALALCLEVGALSLLTPARVRNELLRFFKEKAPLLGLKWLLEKGVFSALGARDVSFETLEGLLASPYFEALDLSEKLEALALLLAREEDFLARLGIPASRASALISSFKELCLRRKFLLDPRRSLSEKVFFLERLPRSALLAFQAQYPEVEGVLSAVFSAFKLRPELDGKALQALGVRPGPLLGEMLKRLRAARIDGQVKGPDEELAWLKKEFPDVFSS